MDGKSSHNQFSDRESLWNHLNKEHSIRYSMNRNAGKAIRSAKDKKNLSHHQEFIGYPKITVKFR